MFQVFKNIGDFVAIKFGLSLETNLGSSVSFFVEDSIKIFFLIYAMIFLISLFRVQLSPERIKNYLKGKSLAVGYVLAVFLGVVTPFCSCSSIPLFIAFVAAGIPFGVAMTFLISSPLISEIAAVMLCFMPQAGVKVAALYVFIGAVISILGGVLVERYNLESFKVAEKKPCCGTEHSDSDSSESISQKTGKERLFATLSYANSYAFDTVKTIAPWVIVGLLIGAFMHGYVPQEFFAKYLGAQNPFAVPLAAIAGIPIYADHKSVLPIIQVLLLKGVPVGTSLVALMSITAISLPEMVMLHKVMSWRLLAMFATFLIISFIIVGYIINAVLL